MFALHQIQLIKEKTKLSDNTVNLIERKLNSIITNELKKYHKMKIYILDKDEDNPYEDNNINPDYLGIFSNDPSGRGDNYPYIEIYPNRIKNSLHTKTYASMEFKIIMTTVIIHELSHAYMFPFERDIAKDTIQEKDKYDCYLKLFNCLYHDNEPFKTIEESLANWIAYNQNWEYHDREIVRDFIFRQPSDCKNALSFIHVRIHPYELATQWRQIKKTNDTKISQSECQNKLECVADCIKENKLLLNFSFVSKCFEEINLFDKLGCKKYLKLKNLKDKLK